MYLFNHSTLLGPQSRFWEQIINTWNFTDLSPKTGLRFTFEKLKVTCEIEDFLKARLIY